MGWGVGVTAADYDNDGWVDVYLTNLGPDVLYRNNGDGTFTEQSDASGAADEKRYFGLGVVTADVDGDRDLDIYVGNDATPNYLFVNRGNGRFDERGFESGTAVSGDGNEQASMGVAAADYDNDGDLDLVVACLDSRPLVLRNDAAPGRWLMLRAVGRKGNRDAIGARVTVRTGERCQVWEVKRTVGIYSASDPRAHFGLGDAGKADLIRVEWPGGKVDAFRDVTAGRHYLVDEAKGLSREPLRGH